MAIVNIFHLWLLHLCFCRYCFFRRLDTNQHQRARHIIFDLIQHHREQLKCFALIFLFRILLCVTAQMNTLTQMIQRRQMFTPVHVDALQHDITFKTAKSFFADQRDFFFVRTVHFRNHAFKDFVIAKVRFIFHHLRQRQMDIPVGSQHTLQRRDIPLFFHRLCRHICAHQIMEYTMTQ